MTDPGLSNRLRQKSRRAGIAVGLTMALTILICVGASTAIYAALVQPLTDIIPVSENPVVVVPPTATAAPTEVAQAPEGQDTPQPADSGGVEPAPTATAESGLFQPTHQIRADSSVNFRGGPSTSDEILRALSPETALQYLDEDAPTASAEDGDRWMKFKLEDGEEGWVREIDIESYRP